MGLTLQSLFSPLNIRKIKQFEMHLLIKKTYFPLELDKTYK